jgi:hypothetical protein
MWTYGIQPWGTASNSNTEIFQHFQSKTLRSILNAPWYINNHWIRGDLQMNTVLSEIKEQNTKYLRKLENHTNVLALNLLDNSETTHRLKRYTVLTLQDRPEQNPQTRNKVISTWTKEKYTSYATGHNTFTSQYLLNIYIYCRLCIINCGEKEAFAVAIYSLVQGFMNCIARTGVADEELKLVRVKIKQLQYKMS